MNLKRWLKWKTFIIRNGDKEHFECPICSYKGPFMDISPDSGFRLNAKCAKCGSLERHRLQYLIVSDIFNEIDVSMMTILHVAPEGFLKRLFRKNFGKYESADINRKGVDHIVDLQDLPFNDSTYDFVFASHVLEHIPDDQKALEEIRRVLKPNGIAILPVPIRGDSTIEYLKANPEEHDHVRAPGMDYFERFKNAFPRIDLISSDSFHVKYQLYVCELNKTKDEEIDRRVEIVPVCYT